MEETLLKFTTKDVTIELSGSEEFVERQIRFFRHYLEQQSEAEQPAAEKPEPEPERDQGRRPALQQFYQDRASKAGRGAIQESLLLFGYYLEDIKGQPEFSIEQIGGCFGVVGRPMPKNLHHAVGTLKRKHKWFLEGSKRGHYRLSDRGRKLVKPLS